MSTARVIGLTGLVCVVAIWVAGCAPMKDKAHDLSSAFSGNYDSLANGTPADVIAATHAAVKDLGLILISANTQPDQSTTIVIARSTSDEKVTVSIVPLTPTSTRFAVTTGVFGNSTLREQVMDAIKLHVAALSTRPSTGPSTRQAASEPTSQP